MKAGLEPPLADTLSAVLPSERQTRLLRACLLPGEAGRRTWTAWREQVEEAGGGLDREVKAAGRLLPLLWSAWQERSGETGQSLATLLRVATYREELRSSAYAGLCREALTALAGRQIPAIVINGAALASTVYDRPALRHCHDLDLLIRGDDLAGARQALAATGYRRISATVSFTADDLKLAHARGLGLELHSRPFGPPGGAALDEVWTRTETRLVAGVSARVLSPADALLQACGRAAYSASRGSLVWACDAWQIIRRCSELDWEVLLASAAAAHLALPAYAALSYLRSELEAAVPARVLEQLAAAAWDDVLGRDHALAAARRGPGGDYSTLWRHSRRWRSRADLLRWLLLPSPGFLRWDCDADESWPLPLWYLYRPLRYGARRWLARPAPQAGATREVGR
jgi:hypothetical protein